jgi:hypothetical protein
MVSAMTDVIHVPKISLLALKGKGGIKASVVCLDGGLPTEIHRELCGWVGASCGVIGNHFVFVVDLPMSASIDADYSLFVHQEWASVPSITNGRLSIAGS